MRILGANGATLDSVRDFVLNDVMAGVCGLNVLHGVLAAVQGLVSGASNPHLGQDGERLLSSIADRCRAIEEERSELMLKSMRLSISEALDCGVESGDVFLSRENLNQCIKRAHLVGQAALPSTSAYTNLRDASFPFTDGIFKNLRWRRSKNDDAVGMEASEMLTQLAQVEILRPLEKEEESAVDFCAVIREVSLCKDDQKEAEKLRIALEDKHEWALRCLTRSALEILHNHCRDITVEKGVLLRCYGTLALTTRFCVARLCHCDVEYGGPRLASSLSLLSDTLGSYWCYRNHRQWRQNQDMEGREDEERLLSILQARLLELKGQCKEKTRAALWQHAACMQW